MMPFAILTLALACPASVETAVIDGPPMMAAVDPFEYVIGPGDQLWISVPGGMPFFQTESNPAGVSIVTIPVTPDGNVVIPMVGAVYVSGMTLSEASLVVESSIRMHYRDVEPEVGLSMLREFRVPVTGQVMGPGLVTATGVNRVSEILEMAGGILPGGSLSGIMVVHDSGDTTIVDLGRFISVGDMEANPVLSLGDRVHVPMAAGLVYVEGALHIRGEYRLCRTEENDWFESGQMMMEYLEGETVTQLIARAGGLTPWASLEEAHILRSDGDERLVIPAMLASADEDPTVMPGDVLVVPGISPTVSVTGRVSEPGSYPYVAMKGYMHYVGLAGGFDERASSGSVRIILADGTTVDADGYGPVPAGSIVDVPERSLVWWQDHLLILTSLASVVIAYKSIFD